MCDPVVAAGELLHKRYDGIAMIRVLSTRYVIKVVSITISHLADGYSYERSAIAQWFESGKETSPMTNEPLEHTMLIPNKTLYLLLKKLSN